MGRSVCVSPSKTISISPSYTYTGVPPFEPGKVRVEVVVSERALRVAVGLAASEGRKLEEVLGELIEKALDP